MPSSPAIRLSRTQIHWFRARRNLLVEGAGSLAEAAEQGLGIQAQQLGPACWGIAQRCRSSPTAAKVQSQLFDAPRSLVRCWGPRDTLHLYSSAQWASVLAARPQWSAGGRSGVQPDPRTLHAFRQRLESSDRVWTRRDLVARIPPTLLARATEKVGAEQAPLFAAGRILWRLTWQGVTCLGRRRKAEQEYPTRVQWHSQLPWPFSAKEGFDPLRADPAFGFEAACRWTHRYLAVHGPATVHDLAHFFQAPIGRARAWLRAIADTLLPVEVDGQELVGLAADEQALRHLPPRGVKAWPLRLLPLWDATWMAHADKSWTVPHAEERAQIWRPGGYVRAVVFHRGIAVALWKHQCRRQHVEIQVEPLQDWQNKLLPAVHREARRFAAHLGLDEARVERVGG